MVFLGNEKKWEMEIGKAVRKEIAKILSNAEDVGLSKILK